MWALANCAALLAMSACVPVEDMIITPELPIATPYQAPIDPTLVLETPTPAIPPTATPSYVAYVILEGENIYRLWCAS